MKALVVASLTDEEYAQSEISALVNILDAELILGADATSRNLMDKLNAAPWDIVWFVGHGTDSGISLQDGNVDSGILTSLIRNARPKLVVFNTCSSLAVAMDIYNEVTTNFICTVSEVPSRLAFFTGKQLAVNLSRGFSFKDAYLRSKSGQNRNYIFLSGADDHMFDYDKSDGNTIPLDENSKDILHTQNDIKRLIAIIDGDDQWGLPGLKNVVQENQLATNNLLTLYSTVRNTMIGLVAINLMILTALIIFALQIRL